MNKAAVILMAGLGTRMKSKKPKVLHKVSGQCLADYVVHAASATGACSIIGVIGAQAELVREHFKDKIQYALQEKQMGTGHAMQMAIPYLKDYCGALLVLCGDAPLISASILESLISYHQTQKAAITVLSGIMDDPSHYGRVCKDLSGNILRIVESKECTADEYQIKEINSGIYCFSWPEVEFCLKDLPLHIEKNEYFLTDIISIAIKRGLKVQSFTSIDPNVALGVNSQAELSKIGSIMRKNIMNMHMDNGVAIVDPDNTYIDSNVEIGQETVIYPYTVIENGVKIGQNCKVGPFAHLRSGTELKDFAEIGNFVEVKNSVVASFTKAKHLTYLGDACIGENVNVGAGTITANYDGKHKHKTYIEDGAFIGSGTILVAPVSVGKKGITGAGAVITKGHNVPEGETVIGIPARLYKKNKK